MRLKALTTAVAASALAMSSVAVAQQAAPSAASTQLEPMSEEVEGSQVRGGFLLPLAFVIAVIVGVLLLTKDDEEDFPVSP